jgi:hypothetical protein
MASFIRFHERAGAVPDIAGELFCLPYTICSLAASRDSNVKMAS